METNEFLSRAREVFSEFPSENVGISVYDDGMNGLRFWVRILDVAGGHWVRFTTSKDGVPAYKRGKEGTKTIEEAIQVMKDKIDDYRANPLPPKEIKEKKSVPAPVFEERIERRDHVKDFERLKGIFSQSDFLRHKILSDAVRNVFKVSIRNQRDYMAFWLEVGMLKKEGVARSPQAGYRLGAIVEEKPIEDLNF